MEAIARKPVDQPAEPALHPRPWRACKNGTIRDANEKLFAIVAMPDPPSVEERLGLAEAVAREIVEVVNAHGLLSRAVRATYRGLGSAIPPGTTAWGIAAREVSLAITLLDG